MFFPFPAPFLLIFADNYESLSNESEFSENSALSNALPQPRYVYMKRFFKIFYGKYLFYFLVINVFI